MKQIRKQPAVFASLALAIVTMLMVGTFMLGTHIRKRAELRELLDEARLKLAAGDLQTAHELITRAGQIDADRTAELWGVLQGAMEKQRTEGLRLAAYEAEREAVDPLLLKLRDIQWTHRAIDFRQRLDELVQEADRLVGSHPEWAGAWLARGWAGRSKGDFRGGLNILEGALKDLDQAVARAESSESQYRPEAYLQRALAHTGIAFRTTPDFTRLNRSRSSSNHPVWKRSGPDPPRALEARTRAIQDLKVYLGAAPQGGTRAYAEALMSYLSGHFDAAIERLSRADASWSSEELLLQARCFYFAKGDLRLKRDVEYVAESTRRPDVLNLAALMNIDEGEFKTAERFLTFAVQIDPDNGVRWINLATARIGQGNLKGAEEACSESIQRSPNLAEGYLLRAIVRRQTKDWEGGLLDAERAVQLKPQNPAAHFTLGCQLFDFRRWDDAIEAFSRTIELDPNAGQAYCNRGNARIQRSGIQAIPESMPDWEKAIELEPGDSGAYLARGSARMIEGNYEAAIEDLSIAKKLRSGDPTVFYNLGVSREALAKQKPERALELLRMAESDLVQALRIAPSDWAYRMGTEQTLERVRTWFQKLGQEH
jgi:tetratricopeptide (TPR) repeat protein